MWQTGQPCEGVPYSLRPGCQPHASTLLPDPALPDPALPADPISTPARLPTRAPAARAPPLTPAGAITVEAPQHDGGVLVFHNPHVGGAPRPRQRAAQRARARRQVPLKQPLQGTRTQGPGRQQAKRQDGAQFAIQSEDAGSSAPATQPRNRSECQGSWGERNSFARLSPHCRTAQNSKPP